MTSRPTDLPDYDNPPVAEVVFGVQFSTPKPLQTPHLGLYWETIRGDFPKIEEQAPLPPQTESLGETEPEILAPALHFRPGAPPLRRCWFINDSGNRVIQVQEDRFIHNWRKESPEPYPRYEPIRDEFLRRWAEFASFVERQQLGQPEVEQCELTYVNHILKGSCWSEMADALQVFSFWTAKGSTGFLPAPESVTWHLRYLMPKGRGRLHVSLCPAIRTRDRQFLLQLKLTACGPVTDGGDKGLFEWFQEARSWIVCGFTDLTTSSAWEFWRRKA